jgi:hypothetical protein
MMQVIKAGLMLLIASSPVLLAAAGLLIRDRLTFSSDMSREERDRITRIRSIRALNRWRVFILCCAVISLPFNLVDFGHRDARYRSVEAIIAIFFIFRYYNKRSEIQIPDPTGLDYTLPDDLAGYNDQPFDTLR